MKLYLEILKYLRPYKMTVLVTWVLSILVLALQGISVWVAAGFIEKLLVGQPLGTSAPDTGGLAQLMDRIAVNVLQQSTPFLSLIAGTSVLLGAALLTAFFRIFKTYLFARINQAILVKIRTDMFSHITRLDLSFSRRFRPGEITSLFIEDADQIKTAIIDAADRVFMQPLRLIMGIALMLSLSVELTLWTLLFLILSSLAVHLAGDRIENLTEKILEKAATLQGVLTEYLSAVILARILGRESYEKERFEDACNDLANTAIELSLARSVAPQLIKNLFILSGGMLLLIGGYRVLVSHTISGTILVKMILLLPVITYPIEALASLYLSIRASLASAKRVFHILGQQEQNRDWPDAADPQPFRHSIEFRDASYIFDGNLILDNISMTIPCGSKVVIFGQSGAGKTTILSLIAGLAQTSKGAILIDGIDLRQLKSAAWRQRLGIVIQEPILLNGTVRENLLYARADAAENEMRQVLKETLLWNHESVFPQGLDTPVGNRGEMISGGERQRLTIARVLLNDPEILLMDEPTAMLDVTSKKKIRDTICSVANNRTLIIVTHDPYLREIADMQFEIDSGRLII